MRLFSPYSILLLFEVELAALLSSELSVNSKCIRSPSPLLPPAAPGPPWTSTGNEKGDDAQSDNSLTPWPSEVGN